MGTNLTGVLLRKPLPSGTGRIQRAIQSAFEAGGGKGFEMFLNEDGRQAKTAAEVIGEIQRFSLLNFCSDCKVAVGALHHEGCEREECPRCGRPARSCQCPDGDPV